MPRFLLIALGLPALVLAAASVWGQTVFQEDGPVEWLTLCSF